MCTSSLLRDGSVLCHQKRLTRKRKSYASFVLIYEACKAWGVPVLDGVMLIQMRAALAVAIHAPLVPSLDSQLITAHQASNSLDAAPDPRNEPAGHLWGC